MNDYLISGSAHFSPALYLFIVIGLSAAGAAMLIFAKRFERTSQTSSWRGPHSARYYRMFGAVYLLLAMALASPLFLR